MMKNISGILDVHGKGFGFLRDENDFFKERSSDPFVSNDIVKRLGLKTGVYLEGQGDTGKEGNLVLRRINSIDHFPVSKYQRPVYFNRLTSIAPHEKIKLETKDGSLSMRIVDLIAPIGKGSRSLIVSPPKVGKTTFLKDIAHGISVNHPEIDIFALLVDERPEEVTDIKRSIKGQVFASSMDQPLVNHVRLTRIALEILKRKIERGKDVVLLVDSLTRVSRAFNTYEGDSGRTLTGGLDSYAMEFPRSFFGSARKIENGGSLTIIATALVNTGSKMDELIYREFQGTGNQEITLSRWLANKRIFPAIDLEKTHTRKEEYLLKDKAYLASTRIRKGLSGLNTDVAMERLIETVNKYPDNASFVQMLGNALSV